MSADDVQNVRLDRLEEAVTAIATAQAAADVRIAELAASIKTQTRTIEKGFSMLQKGAAGIVAAIVAGLGGSAII
jgi:predicted P-loop ATPase